MQIFIFFSLYRSNWPGQRATGRKDEIHAGFETQPTYYTFDRRHPEANSIYTHDMENELTMNFDDKLFENIQHLLRACTIENEYYNNGFFNFEEALSSKNFDEVIDPDERRAYMRIQHNAQEADAERKPLINDMDTVSWNKTPFNMIRWLDNEDEDMEMDSEMEMQELMRIERVKEREEHIHNKERPFFEARDRKEKKKQRLRRFLLWAKRRLHLEVNENAC